MRALVISGGGSKGAYAGGVAEYLIRARQKKYDIFVGTSTGSLLLTHLALGKIPKLYKIYTNVNQKSIFSLNPFKIRKKGNHEFIGINYLVPLWQFLRRKRTFGESGHLKNLIRNSLSREEFEEAKNKVEDLVVTVSNLSNNSVEYKSIKDYSYEEFCDWIWISCNYVPFMSLAKRNGYEYADGGFGSIVPIREAIRRGATEVDAVILQAESIGRNQALGKNPFSLMVNLFRYMLNQVESGNVVEGKLVAKAEGVKLNLYYTPSKLTENSLIFNKTLMTNWWQQGFEHAAKKEKELKKEQGTVESWWAKLFN